MGGHGEEFFNSEGQYFLDSGQTLPTLMMLKHIPVSEILIKME